MLLRALLGRQEHRFDATVPGYGPIRQPLTGPVHVNDATTLSVTAAFRCVQLISDSIGRLPLQAFRDGEQLDPTPPLLKRPETLPTRMETIAAAVTSLLIHGNAYALVADRDYLGHPTSIVLLSPHAVTVRQLPDGSVMYQIAGNTYDPDDVLHIRGTSLPGALTGMGVLETQRQTIGQSIAAESYASELWTTGAVPDGVLHAQQDMTPDEARELQDAFVARHGGRQRRPPVLVGVEYKPTSFSNVDLEMLESRKWNAVAVCQMFGVPPFLAGVPSGESKTYQNVQQDKQAFVDFTLAPWLGRIEEALTTMLPRGQRARFNLDAMLRADTLARYQAHKIGIDAGFLSVDEARDLEELTGPAPKKEPVPAPLAAVPDDESETA